MNCSAVSHKKPQLDLRIPASCPWCAWDRADEPLSALIITRQGLLFFNKRDNWLSLSGWLCLVSGNGNGSDQMPRSHSQSSLIREGPANLRTTPLQKQGKGQLTAEWSPLRPSVRAQVKGWWRRSILRGPYGDPYGQSLSMPFHKKHSAFFHPFALASITAWECNETAAWSTDRQSTCLVRWCTCKWIFSMHGSMWFFFLSFKQCSHQTAHPQRVHIGWNFIPFTIVIFPLHKV